MKNITKISAIAILMIASSLSTFAQLTADATAYATIIAPIAITKTVDMNFGNVAVQAGTGGTVVLPPTGSRTKIGGVSLPSVTGTVNAVSFNIIGDGIVAISTSGEELSRLLCIKLIKKMAVALNNPKTEPATKQKLRNELSSYLNSNFSDSSIKATVLKCNEILNKPEKSPEIVVKGGVREAMELGVSR